MDHREGPDARAAACNYKIAFVPLQMASDEDESQAFPSMTGRMAMWLSVPENDRLAGRDRQEEEANSAPQSISKGSRNFFRWRAFILGIGYAISLVAPSR